MQVRAHIIFTAAGKKRCCRKLIPGNLGSPPDWPGSLNTDAGTLVGDCWNVTAALQRRGRDRYGREDRAEQAPDVVQHHGFVGHITMIVRGVTGRLICTAHEDRKST